MIESGRGKSPAPLLCINNLKEPGPLVQGVFAAAHAIDGGREETFWLHFSEILSPSPAPGLPFPIAQTADSRDASAHMCLQESSWCLLQIQSSACFILCGMMAMPRTSRVQPVSRCQLRSFRRECEHASFSQANRQAHTHTAGRSEIRWGERLLLTLRPYLRHNKCCSFVSSHNLSVRLLSRSKTKA